MKTLEDRRLLIFTALVGVPESDRCYLVACALSDCAAHDRRQLRPIADEEPEILKDDSECPDLVASEAARGVVRS